MRTVLLLGLAIPLALSGACARGERDVAESDEGAAHTDCIAMMQDPQMRRDMMSAMMSDSMMRAGMMGMMMQNESMRGMMMRHMMEDSQMHREMMQMMSGMSGMESLPGTGM